MLYRLNKATGAATAIGNTGIYWTMDLAFDSQDHLYATVNGILYRVDVTTGAVVSSVSTTLGAGNMGIMFDENDTLWATLYTGNSGLYRLNPTTGVGTLVFGDNMVLSAWGRHLRGSSPGAWEPLAPWDLPAGVDWCSIRGATAPLGQQPGRGPTAWERAEPGGSALFIFPSGLGWSVLREPRRRGVFGCRSLKGSRLAPPGRQGGVSHRALCDLDPLQSRQARTRTNSSNSRS